MQIVIESPKEVWERYVNLAVDRGFKSENDLPFK